MPSMVYQAPAAPPTDMELQERKLASVMEETAKDK
jgi:hypothetical protein